MLAISNNEAQELIDGADYDEVIKCAGGKRYLLTYLTESGKVVEQKGDGEDEIHYYFMDQEEASLTSLENILRSQLSHLPAQHTELEMYRWGIEKAEEANSDTFGSYRVLVTKADGEMDWFRNEKGGIAMFDSLAEAKDVCKDTRLKDCKPVVV